MASHLAESLLWGLVGALAFLVLVQGYRLATGRHVTLAAMAGVAALVGVVATVLTYWVRPRVTENESA